MLYIKGKEIVAYYRGVRPIMEYYHGKLLVWQAIRSCFGHGYWVPNSPWIDNDIWKNN